MQVIETGAFGTRSAIIRRASGRPRGRGRRGRLRPAGPDHGAHAHLPDHPGEPPVRPDVTGKDLARSWRTLPARDRVLVWCLLPVIVIMQFFGGRKRLLAPDVAVEVDW